jgi:hypothetical protein
MAKRSRRQRRNHAAKIGTTRAASATLALREGLVLRSPINSIGYKLAPFSIPALGVGVVLDDSGWPFLSYRMDEQDDKDWTSLYTKLSAFATALSIATFGHFWLDDRVFDEQGRVVWERPRAIRLILEKEGDPEAPYEIDTGLAVGMIDLLYHISTHYPRVLLYHDVGRYLLRTPYPGHEFNADILLNFFKIGEVVTASLLQVKPRLADIQRASRDLGIKHFSDAEIKRFYSVRSRDAAHDWLQAKPIPRELAVDCKMWSELMIFKDWRHRGVPVVKRGPRPAVDAET